MTGVGNGSVLGNLLCRVGNLLNQGLSLEQLLSGQGAGGLPGLTEAEVTQLLGGLTDLLNGALGNLANAVVVAGNENRGGPRACPVLHLELGPVTLNLLGLVVELDNCTNGPVTVDITAVRGAGNLLGNLLCSRGHGLFIRA